MDDLLKADKFLMNDLFHFICGDQIGKRGSDRIVFVFKPDPLLVIKIDTGGRFANVEEWRVWNSIKRDKPTLSKFLAPCIQISDCGKVLLQQRTEPLLNDVDLFIPHFMWDIKKENWGILHGQVVCHDYANNIFHRKVKDKIVKAFFYE